MASKKQKASTRNTHITVRVTKPEREKLAQKAAGRTLSCYVRGLIFSSGSRPALRSDEQHCIRKLTLLSERVDEHIEIVATTASLKRSDVTNLLKEI